MEEKRAKEGGMTEPMRFELKQCVQDCVLSSLVVSNE